MAAIVYCLFTFSTSATRDIWDDSFAVPLMESSLKSDNDSTVSDARECNMKSLLMVTHIY